MRKILKFINKNLTLLLLVYPIFSEEYKNISCILHTHSNFSGTSYTINEITNLAIQNNIDSVILTDHYLQKVEFGLWPLRNIIKKSISLPSVRDIGIEKYLNEIHHINNLQKNVILIAAIETTPHYFWSVSKENDGLVINNLHKHILIISNNKDLYLNLPVVGNKNVERFNFLSLWPLAFLLIGLFIKSKTIIIFSLILLATNYPFKYFQFSQYKNYDEKPYQNLINHVNQFNQKQNSDCVIIWAHPEAYNYQKQYLLKTFNKLKIYTQTKPYYGSLLKTYNYDGFSIFAEGYRNLGNIYGIWDILLTEYCEGKREKPIWCYSEVDFGETKDPINIRKNILYVKEKSYKDIISALKNGSFYAVWGEKDKELLLKNFKFCNKDILFGSKNLVNDKEISISFEIKFSNNENLLTKVYIIRNNKVVFQLESTTPIKISFKEQKPKQMAYYRIYIESKYPHKLATNPIFIK